MTSFAIKTTTAALSFIVLSFAAERTWAAAPSSGCGRIATVAGVADVLRLQRPGGAGADANVRFAIRVSKPGFELRCDDVIATGPNGGAVLELAKGRISMAPNARLELIAGSARVSLAYGRMRAIVKKSGDPNSATRAFEVKTFSAVVGVRGTDFFAAYDPNEGVTEQATIEGSVEVKQVGTERAIVVGPGQQTAIEPALALPGKQPLPSATREPLKVAPISEVVRSAMRAASAVARDDSAFAHPKAVEALGPARDWTIRREALPDRLKAVPNEF